MQSKSQSRSHRAREVAEILINNSTSEHLPSGLTRTNQSTNATMINGSLHNSLVNNGDYLHDAVIAGSTTNGRMSAVRRFFCLFVTFDLMFTTLLWIICFVITGVNIKEEIYRQVVQYTISQSLFDIVMASASRFVILILFYALLRVNHWFVIALTTSGSCAFLVAKVFLYKWASTSSYTLEVFLILSSFIISWGQAWFLDFRVIPQESQARDFLRAISIDEERQPLIGRAQETRSYRSGADTADFYSPIDSPFESDDERETNRLPHRNDRLTREDEEYVRKGEECFNEAWAMINSDGWKEEKKTAEGDIVHSKFIRRTHKIFRITGTVDIPPHLLYEELHRNIENVPSWNPTLIECRSLKVIDDKTSISYQVAAEGGGGIVSSRDFVNLRYCDIRNGIYICSGQSIPFAEMPPQKGHVRGENGPGCWVMRPIPNEPNKCIFQWLLDTNLKGWIPQSIIDSALSFAMCDYVRFIRNYGATLHQEGKF